MPSISSVDNVASCSAEKSTEAMLVEAMILDRSSVVELVRNLVKRQEPNVLDLWSYVLSIEYIRCTIASSQTDSPQSDCLSARFGRRHRRRFFNRRVLSGAYKQAFSAREIAQSARHLPRPPRGNVLIPSPSAAPIVVDSYSPRICSRRARLLSSLPRHS